MITEKMGLHLSLLPKLQTNSKLISMSISKILRTLMKEDLDLLETNLCKDSSTLVT